MHRHGFTNARVIAKNLPLYIYGLITTWLIALGAYPLVFTSLGLTPSYALHPVYFSLYFLFFLCVVRFLYAATLKEIFSHISVSAWRILAAFHIFLIFFFVFLAYNFTLPPADPALTLVQFYTPTLGYLLVKIFEVALQQVFIVLLVLALDEVFKDHLRIAIGFAAGFFVAHLQLAFILPLSFVTFFAASAAFAGFLFPYILLKTRNGFVYTYMFHWLFYLSAICYVVVSTS